MSLTRAIQTAAIIGLFAIKAHREEQRDLSYFAQKMGEHRYKPHCSAWDPSQCSANLAEEMAIRQLDVQLHFDPIARASVCAQNPTSEPCKH